MDSAERLTYVASALSIGSVERHLFLCAEQKTPKCAPYEVTSEVWRYLKGRLKELNLASAPPPWGGKPGMEPFPVPPGGGRVLRSKVDCLRICESGPIDSIRSCSVVFVRSLQGFVTIPPKPPVGNVIWKMLSVSGNDL